MRYYPSLCLSACLLLISAPLGIAAYVPRNRLAVSERSPKGTQCSNCQDSSNANQSQAQAGGHANGAGGGSGRGYQAWTSIRPSVGALEGKDKLYYFITPAPTKVPDGVTFPDDGDCGVAKKNIAYIDAFYTYEGYSFLNYVVRINATGQRNDYQGWCNGIQSNILGQCGHTKVDIKGCGTWGDEDKQVADDKGVLQHGIDMNFRWDSWVQGSWAAGEDNRACIGTAIVLATCAASYTWQSPIGSGLDGGPYRVE